MKLKKWLAAGLSLSVLLSTCAVPGFAAEGTTQYQDGTYQGTATVEPDEYLDFDAYDIKVDVTVAEGKVTSVAFAQDCVLDEENETYANRAMNGRGSNPGVAAQIIEANSADEVDAVSTATCSSVAIQAAAKEALAQAAAEEPVEFSGYVLMNIPYADFYAAELRNEVSVDAVTSATLNKTRTGTLVGGSYHVDPEGTDISGIVFPVKVSDLDQLAGLNRITDEDSVTIEVTNRGQTSSTTYTGSGALFEAESYSYYILTEAPDYYKELTVAEDGTLSFGAVVGEVQEIEAAAELTTETSYGDYQVGVEGLPEEIGSVYAVILSTDEADYGLRHLENVWRTSELAWCTGFTASVHSSPTSSAHYEAMMGQTIRQITYYTDAGLFRFDTELYVPVKFDGSVSVEDALISTGETAVEFVSLPQDFDPAYSVEGLEIQVSNGVLTFTGAQPGTYTLVVSDQSGKYAALSTSFVLSTDEQPAAYNGDDNAPALVAAEGGSQETFQAYLAAVSSVSVNGTDYAASGRGAVVIVKEDGAIDLTAEPFAESGEYEVVVSATGYPDLAFTLTVSAAPTIQFTDVEEDDWFAESVQWAVENQITAGTGDNQFSPNKTCTRAEIVTFLWNQAGQPVVTGENPFADVKETDWYYNAVLWAVQSKITAGTGAATFEPNKTCTRAEIVTFLWNQAGQPVVTGENPFADVEETGWYYNAVLWAVQSKITAGTSTTTFEPNKTCTRAEAVTFLCNAAKD